MQVDSSLGAHHDQNMHVHFDLLEALMASLHRLLNAV